MDLVPLVNGLGGLAASPETLMTGAGFLLVVLFLLFSQFGKRLGVIINELMFSNWRLALLGLTGIVLSIASGWTTWDGMSNFTREPILSALVTFGIQGVMLIVAWLIGESFATGMNHRPKGKHGHASPSGLRALQPIASSIAGIMLFSAIGILIYTTFAPTADLAENARIAGGPWWNNWWDKLAIAAPVIVVLTLLIVNAGSDVLEDYTQSLRVMIRSAVLWVMFLACMATSVFFSFDSLFSTIFPASERERAAALRAQNQVAGIVNDIGSLAATRRLTEQEALFATEAWARYSRDLDKLTTVASGAEDKLQAFMEQKLRERQNQLNRFQEDKASAETQQISLTQSKSQLNADIGRLKEQITGLDPEVKRLKGMIFEKDREIIAKTAEAEAEAGGIGVTSKVGRGPKFREISSQLRRLRAEKQNIELQLREFEKRLTSARQRLTKSETELSQTDVEIAKLRSRSDTATRMMDARARRVADAPNFDATGGLQQLAKAREMFRREPTGERLTKVQALCSAVAGAMQSQEALKNQARGIDCDPGTASEAASRVFALNTGIVALQANCIGGSKLPASGGPDAMFSFARRCVQDSGLPSRDTEALRQKINFVELNRDDKAHRFVVTTNAFGDGNKLAYLALSIAIAIDALVFMSGLFGANAVRSPLSDVPSHKGRSARQLEDVVRNALAPNEYQNARNAVSAITPLNGLAPDVLGVGWTHEATLKDTETGSNSSLQRVLNAGATIGAVRRDETYPARYFVRSELIEFLNVVENATREKEPEKVRLTNLHEGLVNSLKPYVSDHADIVLGHMHPISDRSGFSSEVFLSDVPDDDVPILKRSLNVGSTLNYVQRDERKEERDRFYVHSEFYGTLVNISAEFPKYGRRLTYGHQQLAGPDAGPLEGGALHAGNATLPAGRPTAQITSEVAGRSAEAADASVEPHREPSPTPEKKADPQESSATVGPMTSAEIDLQRPHLEQLIQALGINPEVYLQLSGPAFGAALATSEAFKEQRSVNDLLERNLKQRDRQAQQRIDAAHEAIASRLTGEDAAFQRQMLADARNEIEQNWAILMMLPNGPYEILFSQMIENYEKDAADGLLSADKEALLQNARVIRQAIVANPRNSETAWADLKQDLARVTEQDDAADVVPINSRRA